MNTFHRLILITLDMNNDTGSEITKIKSDDFFRLIEEMSTLFKKIRFLRNPQKIFRRPEKASE